MKPIISFCIPVYNQIDMVKECILSILQYPKQDIEIIIGDDCSSDDIKGMVDSLKDSRIKYYKNETNLGHDLNIISTFEKSESDFAFLLRARDRIIPSAIHLIIEYIYNFPNMTYLTGNAVDELGNYRLKYQTTIVEKGKKALHSHMNLLFHPSGSLYALKKLDLESEKAFIKANTSSKFVFVSHHLMRMELAEKGDFCFICDTPIWQYTITRNAKDIAVNSKKNASVLSPEFVEQRFKCEMLWVKNSISSSNCMMIYKWLIKKYMYETTWWFKRNNEDTMVREHYNFEKKDFSILGASNHFFTMAKEVIKELPLHKGRKGRLYIKLCISYLVNLSFGYVRYNLANLFRDTVIYRIYKKNKIENGKA